MPRIVESFLGVLLLTSAFVPDAIAGSCIGGGFPGAACIDNADCINGACGNHGDHLQCYRVQDSQSFTGLVDLDTAQFGLAPGCKIAIKGMLFCAPADKRVISGGGAPLAPFVGQALADDRLCYKVKCSTPVIPDKIVADQFGTRRIKFSKSYLLCTPAAKVPPKIVFVTSQRFAGNFGGIAGGDTICQAAAVTAGLPGTYLAWLSDSLGTSPNSRFVHYAGPYARTDGVLVATSYGDLTDGSILNPIDVDEFGSLIPIHAPADPEDDIWTGTDEFGDPDPYPGGPYTCADWTSTALNGLEGELHLTSPKWTNHQRIACSVPRRLYCFSQ